MKFIDRKSKKGDIIIGDVIFLVLNLIFLSILIIFVISKTNDASLLEEKYAKEIALIIDSAKPGMEIHLNMQDAIKKAEKNNLDINSLIEIKENVVHVKLKEKGDYSYSFFNDVSVSNPYLNINNKEEYIFFIEEKK
jgi:hypothetical protein